MHADANVTQITHVTYLLLLLLLRGVEGAVARGHGEEESSGFFRVAPGIIIITHASHDTRHVNVKHGPLVYHGSGQWMCTPLNANITQHAS